MRAGVFGCTFSFVSSNSVPGGEAGGETGGSRKASCMSGTTLAVDVSWPPGKAFITLRLTSATSLGSEILMHDSCARIPECTCP